MKNISKCCLLNFLPSLLNVNHGLWVHTLFGDFSQLVVYKTNLNLFIIFTNSWHSNLMDTLREFSSLYTFMERKGNKLKERILHSC